MLIQLVVVLLDCLSDFFLELLRRILCPPVKAIQEVLVHDGLDHAINRVIRSCDQIQIVYLVVHLVNSVDIVERQAEEQAYRHAADCYDQAHMALEKDVVFILLARNLSKQELVV